jgi:hypothetical protein
MGEPNALEQQVAIRSRFRIVTPDTLVTSVPSTRSVLTDSQPSLTTTDGPKT